MGSATIPGGFLLAIEGIDGAGKSLQARAVAEVLERRGLRCVLTREPTHGPWGQRLRDSFTQGRLAPADELHAFLEDRRQHVAEVIRPSLDAGRIVLTDRYYFSTVAYQGARGFDPEELLRQNEAIAIEPGLLILIDLPPELGLSRVTARGSTANSFETQAQLARSRAIFNSIRKPYLRRIDGHRPPVEIRDEILLNLSEAVAARLAGDARWPVRDRLNACLALHGAPACPD